MSESRVRATLIGGTAAEQSKFRDELGRVYNADEMVGHVKVYAERAEDGWVLMSAEMAGGQVTTGNARVPEPAPADVAVHVMRILAEAGIPVRDMKRGGTR